MRAHTAATVAALVVAGLTVLPASAPAAAPAAAATCRGTAATIVGTAGRDHLVGTPGRDVIAGLGGNDRISGQQGDDLLCGGRGADNLDGGRGDDTLWGGPDRVTRSPRLHHGDGLVGGPGDDVLDAGADARSVGLPGSPDLVSWAEARRAVHVDLSAGRARGQGHDRVRLVRGASHLSDYDDTFVGSAGADEVHAYDGDDVITTGDGPDLVHLDTDESPGDDRVRTGAGDDVIRSLGGTDVVRAGPGRDYVGVSANPATQTIHTGRGGDVVETVVPDVAGQVLDGGPADDPGTDRLLLSVLADGDAHRYDFATGEMLLGTEATSILVAGFEVTRFLDGHWDLTGSAGPNWAEVNAGSVFDARGGDDTFVGSPEDDTYDGGAGDDRYLRDPGGTDTCLSVERDPEAACDPA